MSDPEAEVRKSKSQVKRDLQALRDLGAELVSLPEKNLKKIPLTEELLESVLEAKQMRRGALRRQIQHIGVLLREEDADAIRQAMTSVMQPHVQEVRAFHEIEQWRDDLLAGNDDLLDSLCRRYAGADRTLLQQLVEKARTGPDRNRTSQSARALFRYLSSLQQEQG